MCEYPVKDWLEYICWNCGYYQSDSPAYKLHPELFENIVIENPLQFIQRFLTLKPSDDSYHDDKSDEKLPEPPNMMQILKVQFFSAKDVRRHRLT